MRFFRFSSKELSERAAWKLLEENDKKRGGSGYVFSFGENSYGLCCFGIDQPEDWRPFEAGLRSRRVNFEMFEEKDLPKEYNNDSAYQTYLHIREIAGD